MMYEKNLSGFAFVIVSLFCYAVLLYLSVSKLYRAHMSIMDHLWLHYLAGSVELFSVLACIAVLVYSLTHRSFLSICRKLVNSWHLWQGLLPLLVAAVLDPVGVVALYLVTRQSCPVPFYWVAHMLVYLCLACFPGFRPYRTQMFLFK